jgi:hypothetical protein
MPKLRSQKLQSIWYGTVHYTSSIKKGTNINKQITLDSFTVLFLLIIIVQTFFKKNCGDEKCPIYWYLAEYKMTPLTHPHSCQFSWNMFYFLHFYKLTSQSSDDELPKSSCLMFGSMLYQLLKIIFTKHYKQINSEKHFFSIQFTIFHFTVSCLKT